jgi:hypothetical protein
VKYFLILFLSLLLTNVSAAPSKDLWPFWQVHNNASTKVIDHRAWTSLLQRYDHATKQGINLFAYQQVNVADKKKLKVYLNYLQSLKITTYSAAQQEAYWINLYNAETVNIVLQHYPVNSILAINISPGWFSRGPWDTKLLTIEGKQLSLNDIEHRILRPIWQDNRLHYALNCASLGCPNLQREAFTATQLNTMLNEAAITFVNSSRGARFVDNKLIISKIYQWYQVDFGDSENSVIQHLLKYAKPGLAKKLRAVNSISAYEYNWQLNVYQDSKS